jgi:hypothetical protein
MNKTQINEYAHIVVSIAGYHAAAMFLIRHGYTFEMTHHALFNRGPRFRTP